MEKDNILLAAIAALGVPVSAVLIRVVDAWTKGSEKRSEDRTRQASEFEQRRAAEVAEVYRRLAEEREANRVLEADRDQGWDLLRAWNEEAHHQRHQHINTLQILMALRPDEAAARKPPPLPPLRDIRRVEARKE